MVRSQRIYVDMRKLLQSPKDSNVIVRLAMAANDLAVVNFCLGLYKDEGSPFGEHLRPGAGMYFVRIQTAHLAEAMKVVGEIERSKRLRTMVGALPADLQAIYDRMVPCTRREQEPEEYKRNVLMVRDKIAFHYDPKLVREAMESRAQRSRGKPLTCSRSTEPMVWRLTIADAIVDTAKCRIIWQVPEDANLREAADECSEYAYQLAGDFLDLAGELVWRYLGQYPVV